MGDMLELYQYFAEEKKKDWKFTQKSVADELGIASTHLCAISRYRVTPCPILALKIEEITGGVVKAWDLILLSLEKRGKTNRKTKEKRDKKEE